MTLIMCLPLVHYTGRGQSFATLDILKFSFVQDGNYGGVQNSSTALGNLAQKLGPYSRMHVFKMFWCYKRICSHMERAERIECPVFPVTYINFRIFFHWKIVMVSWDCVCLCLFAVLQNYYPTMFSWFAALSASHEQECQFCREQAELQK